MGYIQDKRIYYVNSANRVSDSKSSHCDFDYQFLIPENKFDSCVLLDISIPKTYDLIQANQNSFTLNEASSSATITIPAGNYSSTSFMTTLIHELNTNSPKHLTYSCAMNNQGRVEYKVSTTDPQPSFTFTSYLNEQLGFEQNTTNTFVNNGLISANVADFQRESTLFLHSDIVSQGSGDNILQQIFAENTVDFKNIVWTCPDVLAYAKPFAQNSANKFHFWLTDENGNKIDTKGGNLVFTLLIFKKSTAFENINSFIKYTGNFIENYKRLNFS